MDYSPLFRTISGILSVFLISVGLRKLIFLLFIFFRLVHRMSCFFVGNDHNFRLREVILPFFFAEGLLLMNYTFYDSIFVLLVLVDSHWLIFYYFSLLRFSLLLFMLFHFFNIFNYFLRWLFLFFWSSFIIFCFWPLQRSHFLLQFSYFLTHVFLLIFLFLDYFEE